MDIVYVIMRHFFLAGAVASFIYFLFLINRKTKYAHDKIFAIWFLFITINLLTSFFIEQLSAIYPVVFGILVFVFAIVHNPFLFFYIREITAPKKSCNVSCLNHFIPVVFVAIVVIYWYLTKSYEEQVWYNDCYKKGNLEGISFFVVVTIINSFLSLFYVVRSWLLIREHQRRIKNIFSDIHSISLHWVEYFTIVLGLIWFFVIVSIFVLLIADGSVSFSIYYFGLTFCTVYVFYIGFNAKKQRQIFVSLNDRRSYYDLDGKKFVDDEKNKGN